MGFKHRLKCQFSGLQKSLSANFKRRKNIFSSPFQNKYEIILFKWILTFLKIVTPMPDVGQKEETFDCSGTKVTKSTISI